MTKDTEKFFTIYRVSGLSWVHFAKRWKFICPKRLDSKEHQNWARIGSHNQLHMEWKLELSLLARTILNRGSEFLMAWISWSRTWATRRTTTASRKPLRCSSKIVRWKRLWLLLRAAQRLKQNHKDVFLPAHPQKLYPFGKERGPILNHKIIRPSIIQCRRNWSTFFVVVVYLEKMMERLNSGD